MCFLMFFTATNAHQSQLILTTARNCLQIYTIHRAKIFSAEPAHPHLIQILVRSKIKVLQGTHNGMTRSQWFVKSTTTTGILQTNCFENRAFVWFFWSGSAWWSDLIVFSDANKRWTKQNHTHLKTRAPHRSRNHRWSRFYVLTAWRGSSN
jgi:hypothetical protein